MRPRIAALAMVTLMVAFTSEPAHLHAQTPPVQDHEQHHPETKEPPAAAAPVPQGNMMAMMAEMNATNAKLEALATKMNAATGAAKTEAMAELLTALVEARHTGCEAMMGDMMGSMMPMMMKMMGGSGGNGGTAPMTPQK